MSAKFVSGGTIDQPIERDDDWLQAQKEIDANRRRKEEESGQQAGGKSLYEVLQQNKGEYLYHTYLFSTHVFHSWNPSEICKFDTLENLLTCQVCACVRRCDPLKLPSKKHLKNRSV